MSTVEKPTNRDLVTASLRLLALRDMSRVEFVKKLKANKHHEFTADEIAAAVAWCEADGWLNEARYAEVASRRLGNRYGSVRVAATLKQKGVDVDIIAERMSAMKDSELARAREVWARKFDAPPMDAATRAKQTRYLQTRGFSFAIVKQVLAGRVGEDELAAAE
jgi:regulatory protein